MTTAEVRLDLRAFEEEGGVALISPPQRFDGGEEAYDLNIGGAQASDLLRPGRGAWRLVERHRKRPVETLLEIGAGGGTCSLGLVDAAQGATSLLTDPSPVFLGLIRRKLAAVGLDKADVRYATLTGEDVGLLPAEAFDAVVIASALHHVDDWRAFLGQAARTLRPGGVLLAQEPCREGNLMMGMALDVALSDLWPRAAKLHPADVAKLTGCRDSIYFLATSGMTKVGEDKHSFLVNEMIEAASRAGFRRSRFYSNRHFADLADAPDLDEVRGTCSLVQYLDSFLSQHHRVSEDGMDKLRRRLFPALGRLDEIFRAGDGAPLMGCLALER